MGCSSCSTIFLPRGPFDLIRSCIDVAELRWWPTLSRIRRCLCGRFLPLDFSRRKGILSRLRPPSRLWKMGLWRGRLKGIGVVLLSGAAEIRCLELGSIGLDFWDPPRPAPNRLARRRRPPVRTPPEFERTTAGTMPRHMDQTGTYQKLIFLY